MANAAAKAVDTPSSTFLVMATGQIEAGLFEGHDSLYCRYAFSCGPDWAVVKGVEEGITQLSSTSGSASADTGRVTVWNFPIDVTFRATCAHGWPQIVVSVYGDDAFGRSDMILGYGAAHLPLSPGRHEIYVRTFRPLASSWTTRLQSWLYGARPEFIDSLFPAKSEGREVTRVSSFGQVKLVVDVTIQGMAELGYTVSSSHRSSVQLVDPFAAS